MTKNILIAFDGTWNTPDTTDDGVDTSTNVFKFYESVLPVAPDGSRQVAWYDEGVGTVPGTSTIAGASGLGLSRNIRQGYREIMKRFEDDDRVFVIGFSRGAFTARSLVGFIRKCGLLHAGEDKLVDDAFDLYKDAGEHPEGQTAVRFRDSHSRTIGIRFVGVWDTVGALGIPLGVFKDLNDRISGFHDTQLSRIVENAFHALAIDEHRDKFNPTLWDIPQLGPGQTVEQRWFAGAHSDVGGGYPDRRLADITLRWMQEKAEGSGLGINRAMVPPSVPLHPPGLVHDSFDEKLYDRIDREVGVKENGFETVDDSVIRRVQEDGGYRPKGLAKYLERNPPPGFIS